MSTRKNNKYSSIIQHFMEIINTIKLYHWKTYSFPEHKSTDELYESLSGHIDKFVEVMLGRYGGRINKKEFSFKCKNSSESEFKRYIDNTLFYLATFNQTFKNDSDLLNIRDEMVADLNQFKYLLTFH